MAAPTHVIVCGGRKYRPTAFDADSLAQWLRHLAPVVLHHGGAPGVDTWAAAIGDRMPDVEVVAHPTAWREHGRAAGPIRNREMLAAATVDDVLPRVCAFPGGPGTDDMVRLASRADCLIWRPYPPVGMG